MHTNFTKSQVLLSLAVLAGAAADGSRRVAHADDFTISPTGLRYLEIREGKGRAPQLGDTVVVDW